MAHFLRILPSTPSYVKDDLEGPTYNDNDYNIPSGESEDDSHGLFYYLIILFMIAVLLAGLAFAGYYFYERFRHQRLIDEYAANPELAIVTQELSLAEKINLKEWSLNPKGVNHVPEVTSERVEVNSQVGKEEYFKVTFNHTGPSKKAIITNQALEKNKDNCYYEVEILEIDPGVTIAIGLSHKDTFDKSLFPGETNNSVGFTSDQGAVLLNGKQLYTNDINAGFGDTIGIGYTFASGRVWLFHNGILLNDVTGGSPLKRAADPYKVGNKEEIEMANAEVKKKAISLDQNLNYYPVIASSGRCVLQLNIGGAKFRTFNKEIAKGLL